MIFGREQELQTVTAQYEKMLAGNGSVLFLTGEAGLGKTTLVHAWWKQNAIADFGLPIADWKSGDKSRSHSDHSTPQSAIDNPKSAIEFR